MGKDSTKNLEKLLGLQRLVDIPAGLLDGSVLDSEDSSRFGSVEDSSRLGVVRLLRGSGLALGDLGKVRVGGGDGIGEV